MKIPLYISIPETQWFISEENRFVYSEPIILELNHSLRAIAKWESIWTKSFFLDKAKTNDELVSYIRCMADKEISDAQMAAIPTDDLMRIREYLANSYSALEFFKGSSNSKETITSEYVYYWMFSYNIPIECEHWHINRLMCLIELFSSKNSDGSSNVSTEDIYARNRKLNAERKAKYNTTG